MHRAATTWLTIVLLLGAGTAAAQDSFFNFETAHVNPIAMSADGNSLYVVNTPDNRVELFDLSSGTPVSVGAVPVGVEPVTVRVHAPGQIWVVNHLSHTISIVDLASMHVTRSLATGLQPADVVFAGGQAFVSCSQSNEVWVYDLADLAAAPTIVPIEGEEPRALAVSSDGLSVIAAIFESGNGTTIVSEPDVSDAGGPYGGTNPPPNDGAGFSPPINGALGTAPAASLIVRKNPATGQFEDDNGGVWDAFVTWDMHDHDLAVIDVATLGVSYVDSLMNINMHLAVRSDGTVLVVGTEATNEIRFEPNINGRFVRAILALVDLSVPASPALLDLNPHLAGAYATETDTVPQNERDLSIADPRGITFNAAGSVGYVTGLGSNNVAVIDAAGGRIAQIDVGEGPTGVLLDEARDQLYVVNKFSGSVSVVDTVTNTQVAEVPHFDPTPAVVRDGRPFLYDAHRTSGLGVTSCAACHVDGRMDQLAWDLGDPSGTSKTFNQTCQLNPGLCEDFHPIKGPMMTQTFEGIIGTEPLHWRGDRDDLAEFNGAFMGLLGDDTLLTVGEMDAFEAFVETIRFTPNPFRTVDNGLPAAIGNGDPTAGRQTFRNVTTDGIFSCNDCHAIPTGGTNFEITPGPAMFTPQSMKVAQLRNVHEKLGFTDDSNSNKGFGLTHDGSVTTIISFLQNAVFTISPQERRDVAAFVKAFPNGTHAGVGTQVTLDPNNLLDVAVTDLLTVLRTEADDLAAGLIARGRTVDGPRGYTYIGGDLWQSDRADESLTTAQLHATAAFGSELTYTLVSLGTEIRSGIDRDDDGAYDRDEVEHCGDPADASVLPIDIDGSGTVDLSDLATLLANFGQGGATNADGDVNGDEIVDLSDLAVMLANFGVGC